MAYQNMVLQVAQAILPVFSLYLLKELVESVVQHSGDFEEITRLIIAYGGVQLLLSASTQYGTYVATILQLSLTDYLSLQVLHKAVEVDYEFYENPAYQDTLHLAQQQSMYKATIIASGFNAALLNSFSLLFLILFFFKIQSMLALIFVLVSIPLAVVKWYYGFELLRMERQFASLERESSYLYNTMASTAAAKEVRIFGFSGSFIRKFTAIRDYIFQKKDQLNRKSAWSNSWAEGVEVVVMSVTFWFLARSTFNSTISIGVFVIYIQGFQRLQMVSKGFLQAVVQLFQQRVFLKDLFTFLDLPGVPVPPRPQSFGPVNQGLFVDNISFTYPQSDREVLHNISMHCPAGKVIAIVGENGSGKSTLVKLLSRLYHVQSGSIRIDDRNLDDITLKDYRDNVVLLFQDFEKYFLTIEENIQLGDDHASEKAEEAQHAAKLSGAHEFVMKLSRGYKTRLGRLFEGSEQLSGGQWQKLAMARAFYKKAQLVILDEPTSALDALAESEVFRNVQAEMSDKMVILISHRLYNLKLADYIYVMKDGRIAEEGVFDTLVSGNGPFRQLYDMQKL